MRPAAAAARHGHRSIRSGRSAAARADRRRPSGDHAAAGHRGHALPERGAAGRRHRGRSVRALPGTVGTAADRAVARRRRRHRQRPVPAEAAGRRCTRRRRLGPCLPAGRHGDPGRTEAAGHRNPAYPSVPRRDAGRRRARVRSGRAPPPLPARRGQGAPAGRFARPCRGGIHPGREGRAAYPRRHVQSRLPFPSGRHRPAVRRSARLGALNDLTLQHLVLPDARALSRLLPFPADFPWRASPIPRP
ncbi:hypothetical protein METUNv1_00816 [Methyloversatilis universalis FAM5]|uniref:Uncharacterized protein n=1 Tax=Methyloversatilis universalis (strain ATCC BAA-1314 / DSM 25237 / JCM 13912 / CCUG 52030 / FAM5) TaxID=1000565 RepID=F5R914_METUF|nr:hypothetical protein METUNv1_00816 [Methyloversatilis universalis FAM5]